MFFTRLTSRPARRGNAVLVTMIMIGAIIATLGLSVDMLNGRRAVEGLDRRKADAERAAKLVAEVLESRMRGVATGSQLKLTADIVNSLTGDWLSRGYVDGVNVNAKASSAQGIWINDVVVYWRLEPASVYDHTLSISDTNGNNTLEYNPDTLAAVSAAQAVSGASTLNNVVNYEADLNNPAKARLPRAGEKPNSGTYLYDMTIDAYAVRSLDPANLSTSPLQLPTTNPLIKNTTAEAHAQVKRTLTTKYRRLFEYIILYFANGRTGDLEVHPGPALALIGAVHTNGTLYLGKNGATVTFGSSVKNASPPYSWTPKLDQVRVSAVNGIYRAKKQDMLSNYNASTAKTPLLLDPANTAISASWSDGSTTTPVYINTSALKYTSLSVTTPASPTPISVPIPVLSSPTGVQLTQNSDSRKVNVTAGTSLPSATYDVDLVRDGSTTRPQPVKQLANVSVTLTSYRPLEPFVLIRPGGDASTPSVLKSEDPGGANNATSNFSVQSATGVATGLYAGDMMLFYFGPNVPADIWPRRPALFGGEIQDPTINGATWPGLTVRPGSGGTPLAVTQGNLQVADQVTFFGATKSVSGVPGEMSLSGLPVGAQSVGTGYPIAEKLASIPNGSTANDWDYFSNLNAYIPQTAGLQTPKETGSPFLGRYIQNALGLARAVAPGDGLTILERGVPLALTYSYRGGAVGAAPPDFAADLGFYDGFAPNATRSGKIAFAGTINVWDPSEIQMFLEDYCTWLRANYVVYFGIGNTLGLDPSTTGQPRNLADITNQFFHVPLGATSINNLLVREDVFLDRREAIWWRENAYSQNSAAEFSARRVNCLTLNVQAICSFLANTRLDLLIPGNQIVNAWASARFNGAIYVARTPRYASPGPGSAGRLTYERTGVYHPIAPFGYDPRLFPNQRPTLPDMLRNNRLLGGALLYPVIGAAQAMTMNAPTDAASVRTLFGSSDSWACYPFMKRVRVLNGASIDWGGRMTSGRTMGLTIYTPNIAYLQGDYNLVPDSTGNYPPCAIYCDSLATLSNSWSDTVVNANPTITTDASNTVYRAALVIHNVPSDLRNVGAVGTINSGFSDEGSGGVHNVIRYLENWGSKEWVYIGSLVVLDRGRYTRGYNGGSYSPPNRRYVFNADLFSAQGQPPFAEYVVDVNSR